jgi:hypothetical protein
MFDIFSPSVSRSVKSICAALILLSASCVAPTQSKKIELGSSFPEAHRLLTASGADPNIGKRIGIAAVYSDPNKPESLHWYVLRDGTCLCIRQVRDLRNESSVVDSMELGQRGRGYGGKLSWSFEQKIRSLKTFDTGTLDGVDVPPGFDEKKWRQKLNDARPIEWSEMKKILR